MSYLCGTCRGPIDHVPEACPYCGTSFVREKKEEDKVSGCMCTSMPPGKLCAWCGLKFVGFYGRKPSEKEEKAISLLREWRDNNTAPKEGETREPHEVWWPRWCRRAFALVARASPAVDSKSQESLSTEPDSTVGPPEFPERETS